MQFHLNRPLTAFTAMRRCSQNTVNNNDIEKIVSGFRKAQKVTASDEPCRDVSGVEGPTRQNYEKQTL